MKEDIATGQWPGIFSAFNIDVGTGKHQPCPVCCGKDRFRFDDKDGRGTWICNQCGAGNGYELLKKKWQCEYPEARTKVEQLLNAVDVLNKGELRKECANDGERCRPYIKKILSESKPLTGNCLGSIYLMKRGLSVYPSTLRYISALKVPEVKKKLPAILATYLSEDGQGTTVHRIYIAPDGSKPDMKKHKLTLPAVRPMTGGAVRLFPLDDRGMLGIAEGIETAIAAHEIFNVPVWATLTSSLMSTFIPPESVESVIVFGDNDKNYTGQKAAYTLANRLVVKHKLPVSVEVPDCKGDWLDQLVGNKNNKNRGG